MSEIKITKTDDCLQIIIPEDRIGPDIIYLVNQLLLRNEDRITRLKEMMDICNRKEKEISNPFMGKEEATKILKTRFECSSERI